MPRVRRSSLPRRPGSSLFLALVLSVSALSERRARAADCSSPAGLASCFDANSLWLPAGRARFLSIPDTRSTEASQISFGVATEWLHRPVLLHAQSPDRDGRDIHVVDQAVDSSFFLAVGLPKRLELAFAASTRLYQTGAGVGGVSSQTGAPVTRNAVRDPRVGVAYCLGDSLNNPNLGLRLGLDLSVPLGDETAFAGEHSLVAMPSVTGSFQFSALRVSGSLGARLRKAVDFGGVRLENQGLVALGMGVELLDPGLLFISVEAFGLPPLSSNNRTDGGSPQVREARLFPAEWLGAVHSSFAKGGSFTLSLGAGSGIPLSSETREDANGRVTTHFLGLTTPDFRSLLVLRFTPPLPAAK